MHFAPFLIPRTPTLRVLSLVLSKNFLRNTSKYIHIQNTLKLYALRKKILQIFIFESLFSTDAVLLNILEYFPRQHSHTCFKYCVTQCVGNIPYHSPILHQYHFRFDAPSTFLYKFHPLFPKASQISQTFRITAEVCAVLML